MNEILLALSPFIVAALTGWIKGWAPFSNLTDGARVAAVRALAALISFVYVIFGMWLNGNVDEGVLRTAFDALVVGIVPFLSSLGLFHAFFQKRVQ